MYSGDKEEDVIQWIPQENQGIYSQLEQSFFERWDKKLKTNKQTKKKKKIRLKVFQVYTFFFPEGVEPADHGTHSRTYGSQSLGARVSSLRKAPLQWLLSDYQGTL